MYHSGGTLRFVASTTSSAEILNLQSAALAGSFYHTIGVQQTSDMVQLIVNGSVVTSQDFDGILITGLAVVYIGGVPMVSVQHFAFKRTEGRMDGRIRTSIAIYLVL